MESGNTRRGPSFSSPRPGNSTCPPSWLRRPHSGTRVCVGPDKGEVAEPRECSVLSRPYGRTSRIPCKLLGRQAATTRDGQPLDPKPVGLWDRNRPCAVCAYFVDIVDAFCSVLAVRALFPVWRQSWDHLQKKLTLTALDTKVLRATFPLLLLAASPAPTPSRSIHATRHPRDKKTLSWRPHSRSPAPRQQGSDIIG